MSTDDNHQAICPDCESQTVHAVKRRRTDDPGKTIAALECGACGWRDP